MQALDDAVSRTGGRPLASELVDAAALGELSTDLIAVAARGDKNTGAPRSTTKVTQGRRSAPRARSRCYSARSR